jgi:hypothetical protein
MQKAFHFDSPKEHYRSSAAVVWCYDARFEAALGKLCKRMGISNPDFVRIAGGAMSLASPERDSDREFVLDQLRKSVRLHSTGRVILMLHSDCGAYGGLAAFGKDPQAEKGHHVAELNRAAACVREAIPNLPVDCYFVDFEGVWSVAPEPAAAQ